ncbi:hypothetical protein PWT90_04902 [Aphanocladium album]|nr:hypothetical protein PWT90_04902 [Aphanocladium album]
MFNQRLSMFSKASFLIGRSVSPREACIRKVLYSTSDLFCRISRRLLSAEDRGTHLFDKAEDVQRVGSFRLASPDSTILGTATLEKLTTGRSASQTLRNQGHALCLQDADWIVEDFGQKNLADFGTLDFTAITARSSAGDSTPEGASMIEIKADGVTRTSCSAGANGVECKFVQ